MQLSYLTTTNGTPQQIALIAVPEGTTYLIQATVTARRSDAAGQALFVRRAQVYRLTDTNVAVMQGPVDTPISRRPDLLNAPSKLDVTIAMSGNNAVISVVGDIGQTIMWRAQTEILTP